jgi:Protein of unknown function (DUF1800)
MLNSIASGKWNYDAAAHLALRAGFGEPPAELQKWASQGVDATLEHLLPASPPGAGPTHSWPDRSIGAPLTFIYRQLGQLPFCPPNVKGWDGGKSWINTATLAYRYGLAREL